MYSSNVLDTTGCSCVISIPFCYLAGAGSRPTIETNSFQVPSGIHMSVLRIGGCDEL
jgi:hypothetical protein